MSLSRGIKCTLPSIGALLSFPCLSVAEVQGDSFLETFSEPLSPVDWYLADFDQPQDRIVTGWRTELIEYLPPNDLEPMGRLTLSLAPGKEDDLKSFIGAELQRKGFFGFGDYEVYMTAGRGDGMVSSFFTYTGPYFGDPHDEIDFEFLGRDTTHVQLNRFVDGETMQPQLIDLGFDAAETPALYGFEWREDRITWFLNGDEIYEISGEDAGIPTNPSKIMMNIWAGSPGQHDWLKSPAADLSTSATYYCVSFRQPGSDHAECSDYLETMNKN